jgi:S-adenosyl-L-methionine hydrolase (adenosine-forming)
LAHRPIITLTTDFGSNDHFVGAMKGVILDIVPEAQIVDICHSVQAFDVLDGALTISQAYSYFPYPDRARGGRRSGRGHGAAADRGLERQISFRCARQRSAFAGLRARERMHVRHITSEHYFLQPVSNTFHARDIFSPVAAYLAKEVDSLKFGEEVEDYVRFSAPKPKAVDENRLRGVVLKVDRFGNLVTNITPQDAPMLFEAGPAAFKIVVGSREITEIHNAYAEGAPGEVIGILGSMGFLEIAANRSRSPVDRSRQRQRSHRHSRRGSAAAGKGA